MKPKNSSFDFSKTLKGKALSKHIPPYFQHVTDSILITDDGRLIAMIALGGCPFESESDSSLDTAFANMRQCLINNGNGSLASGRLGIWSHISRRKSTLENNWHFPSRFAQTFADKYGATFTGQDFYNNQYLISLVLKMQGGGAELNDNIRHMEDIIRSVTEMLRVFQPGVLGIYHDGHRWRSQTHEMLYWLLNHCDIPVPLSDRAIQHAISASEHIYNYDTVEIRPRGAARAVFATGWTIYGFPAVVLPKCMNFLLEASCEFVFTQSLIYFGRQTAIDKTESQRKFMREDKTSGDTDAAEIKLAQESLGRGDLLFGSYHSALVIFGDSVQEAREKGGELAAKFSTGISAFNMLQATSELPQLFLSQLPGSKYRPLSSIRSTSVLACMFSGHNYSTGKATGNPPGDGTALIPLKTLANGLYHFNTHYSDPLKDVTGQAISGHMLLLGATGVGKTTFQSAIGTFAQRWNPMMFMIDYQRSSELPMRSYGGEYFTLQEGVFTGLNPFQLEFETDEEMKAHLQALYAWVGTCITDQGEVVPRRFIKPVKELVDTVMMLDVKDRRFGAMLHSAPIGSEIRERLEPWCEASDGPYAWAVDSPVNTFNPLHHDRVGFDTTVVLEKKGGHIHPACEPLLSVLFHYKNIMQRAGRMMITIVEEFWMPANFPITQAQILRTLKAGRMKFETIWLISQSPADAIKCSIFEAIVEQTQTKVLLPNPDASYDTETGYKHIGLTEREFIKLKALGKESRTLLIKQSGSSAFARMDLYGFDDHLPILSGDKAGIVIADKTMEDLNTRDPDIWIPEFITRLRKYREQQKNTSL
ncbi:conjugal transfer protein [Klebsiella oxytoca]|uniref:VirB4 family type IV secretion/conjugal transfer ATPase n=1 Tax=Klebsiella oxytoca TaxID=571 RepID=UPI00254D599C|nr:conjugal transfer protein [Klebsiella oxytoca]MEC5509935.1 conjugal transfer protein [Klebsiella oxytoca]